MVDGISGSFSGEYFLFSFCHVPVGVVAGSSLEDVSFVSRVMDCWDARCLFQEDIPATHRMRVFNNDLSIGPLNHRSDACCEINVVPCIILAGPALRGDCSVVCVAPDASALMQQASSSRLLLNVLGERLHLASALRFLVRSRSTS